MTPPEINAQLQVPEENKTTPIKVNEAEFIYNFLRQHQLTATLECGFGYGRSAAHIMAATGAPHIAMDPFQATYQHGGLQNIERLGLDKQLTFFEDYSHNVLPQLLREKRRFDFIFIDGDHKFDGVLVDFYYADLLLNEGGYILFHDTWMRSTSLVTSFVETNRADYQTIPTALRNLHLVHRRGRDQRDGMYFREFYTFRSLMTHSLITWMATGEDTALKRAMLKLKDKVKNV